MNMPLLCEAIHSTETLVGKIHWRRKWQPIPVFLPGKFHGQRSLAGNSPWGHRESDTPERLHRHTQCAYPVWRTYAREVERSFHILPGALYAKLCVYIHVSNVCVWACVCACMLSAQICWLIPGKTYSPFSWIANSSLLTVCEMKILFLLPISFWLVLYLGLQVFLWIIFFLIIFSPVVRNRNGRMPGNDLSEKESLPHP